MFQNHIKIAFRRLAKHKSFSLLNIMGLAVGVACSSLILLWAQDELNYDRFHEKADRIFQVMTNQHFNDKIYTFGSTPGLLAGALKDELPEIAQAARMSWPTDYAFSLGEKSSYESGYMVDSSFFDILSFPLVAGDAKTALRETNSLVITERMAERFFGKENALGKTLKVNNQDEFKVTGV
ncbi:MAG: ABC transporter permease, partial [Saprospiraceae bacterium]|nr:ABC transporter permease [Saprospiraceae bacterium]